MDIAASLIKLFFGSKADKDRKEVEPYLVKIKAVYPTIEALSNDELRAHSSNLKKQIANFIAADEARIVELKARLELPDTSLSDKEKISKEIDETVKRIDETQRTKYHCKTLCSKSNLYSGTCICLCHSSSATEFRF